MRNQGMSDLAIQRAMQQMQQAQRALQGMSDEDRQRFEQQMQEAASCMEDIDLSSLEQMDRRGQQVQAEIKSLCARGRRSAAQDKAVAFGREVRRHPAMKKMLQCGRDMGRMKSLLSQVYGEGNESHVCDGM